MAFATNIAPQTCRTQCRTSPVTAAVQKWHVLPRVTVSIRRIRSTRRAWTTRSHTQQPSPAISPRGFTSRVGRCRRCDCEACNVSSSGRVICSAHNTHPCLLTTSVSILYASARPAGETGGAVFSPVRPFVSACAGACSSVGIPDRLAVDF